MVIGYKINIQKSIMFPYTSNLKSKTQSKNEVKKTILLNTSEEI